MGIRIQCRRAGFKIHCIWHLVAWQIEVSKAICRYFMLQRQKSIGGKDMKLQEMEISEAD